MGQVINRIIRTKLDWDVILDGRFSYLSQEEHEQLLKEREYPFESNLSGIAMSSH